MATVPRNKSIFPPRFFNPNDAKKIILDNFRYVREHELKLKYNPDAKTVIFEFTDTHNGLYPCKFAVNMVKSGFLVHLIFDNGEMYTEELL